MGVGGPSDPLLQTDPGSVYLSSVDKKVKNSPPPSVLLEGAEAVSR